MKKFLKMLLAFSLLLTTASVAYASESTRQVISKNGTRASVKGPTQFFTGAVRIDPLSGVNAPSRSSVANVTFEPGARSHWHTHPLGQTLIITSGVCWTQEWNGKKSIAYPGDVIWCPKDVKHWHGAAPDTAMTHISIVEEINSQNVVWLEPVSDAHYNS